MGWLCQGEGNGYPGLLQSGPGFRGWCVLLLQIQQFCSFHKKNFISHFLVVLLIIAGFANNVAFNLSQPSILYKGRKRNSWRLLTTCRNSAISLRPITAQSGALHAGPRGACLHESHWVKLLMLQGLLHSSACQARLWAQRGGGIPRGISWNAVRSGWGRRHLLVQRRGCDGRWMGRQQGWPVLAAEAELVSHMRSKKMDLPGSTGSVLPIPCNHHSSKGGMVPKSLDFNCLLY